MAKPNDDEMYIAVTRVHCGKFEGIVWKQMNGDKQFTRFYGTKPKDRKRFKVIDGEVYLDGKKCEAEDKAGEAKKDDLTILENRFGLPVYQTGPNDRALWWLVRILLKDKSIGELVLPAQREGCSSISVRNSPAIKHAWCAANVPPYCVDDLEHFEFGDDISGATVLKMIPPKGFTCRPWDQMRKYTARRPKTSNRNGASVRGRSHLMGWGLWT